MLKIEGSLNNRVCKQKLHNKFRMYVNNKQSVCNTTNEPCMLYKKLYMQKWDSRTYMAIPNLFISTLKMLMLTLIMIIITCQLRCYYNMN